MRFRSGPSEVPVGSTRGRGGLDAMPCAQWGLLPEWGVLPGSRHLGSPGIVLIVRACSLSQDPGLPLPGWSRGPAAWRVAWLLPSLEPSQLPLPGLPTPGSEGELDTKLKIAAVLFLCWRGGAGRGAPAPLNDLPTKNKASSLHLLCFCTRSP